MHMASQSRRRSRMGAVMFNKRRIFGAGFNRDGKYVKGRFMIGAHAEKDVYAKTMFQRSQKGRGSNISYDLLVIRMGRISPTGNQTLKSSKPCHHCIQFIKNLPGIRNVYYSDTDGEIVRESAREIQNDHMSAGYRFQSRTCCTECDGPIGDDDDDDQDEHPAKLYISKYEID